MTDQPRCTAHTRRGKPCRQPAQAGKTVCYKHGGAPGSGAPRGNTNAQRLGVYSRRLHLTVDELGELASAATAPPGLSDEIALLRVLIARALDEPGGGEDPISATDRLAAVSRAMDSLATLVTKHRQLTGDTGDDFTSHLLAALRAVGEELGLDL